VERLLDKFSLPKQLLQKATLDDLLTDLSNSESPRLALVLSGGGAKCSYQAGAVVAVEELLRKKLDQRAEELKREGASDEEIKEEIDALSKKLDIKLVVGTSGGAINALLVAMAVTKHPGAEQELRGAWQSFNQQQFLRPSGRFRVLFGVCLGILQSLLVLVAVLLFGRQTMNWKATIPVLTALGLLQLSVGVYFGVTKLNIVLLFVIEFAAILSIIAIVVAVDWITRAWTRGRRGLGNKVTGDSVDPGIVAAEIESRHWRRLTIVILLGIGVVEAFLAIIPGVEQIIEHLPDNHWIEHAWTVAILASKWSYPYPLIIAIAMAVIGWKLFRNFDWDRWREPFVWWTAITLILAGGLMVLDALFRSSAVSKVEGIEEMVSTKMPDLVRKTVSPNFNPGSGDLRSMSQQIMAEGLLQRDLIITSSKLPVGASDEDLNSLPDDLYFYHRSSSSVKPPSDRSFIPLKYNQNLLLDVVIGSSTIYPVFPSRVLNNVTLGPDVDLGVEEIRRKSIKTMRIIDGGFIHNIPIEAAQKWRASHIIVIEASPSRQEQHPQVFLDHALTAFGYLFDQAQRTDLLAHGQGAAAFVLRPTSECEKLNVKPICTDPPDPNLDTFDFSKRAAKAAFDKGLKDVLSPHPLFVKVSGAPQFKSPWPAGIEAERNRTLSRRRQRKPLW